jgi:hypothetical protein
MTDQHDHNDSDRMERRDHVDHRPEGDQRTVVEERVRTEPVAVTEQNKMSGRSFLAGFVAALIAAAIALAVFLAVSDADDDGEIQVDVPAVDVDVDG